MKIRLSNINVMQHMPRNIGQIPKMVDHVAAGGYWYKKDIDFYYHNNWQVADNSDMIVLTRFTDDQRYFIQDGHHRIVATWLAGRRFLLRQEYLVQEYAYEEYLEINFGKTWVTPFDPRTHVRVPDIGAYKKFVLNLRHEKGDKVAIEYIRQNQEYYLEERRYTSVGELADAVALLIEEGVVK